MIKKLKPAWVDEFKAFALKGNVVDMAIGVIIGGAFGKIVTSLVNDIIMPLFAMATGGTKGMTELVFKLSDEKGAPVVKYGVFCQTVLDFISYEVIPILQRLVWRLSEFAFLCVCFS